jgi:membrane fusion protein
VNPFRHKVHVNSARTISATKPEESDLQKSDLNVTATQYGLFRRESLEARQMVWLGRPAVALGLPAALSSVASVLMAAATAALVIFGGYARRVDLRGVILPVGGLIQVSSPAVGWVQAMKVHDGQVVTNGAPLYVVNTDTSNTNGNTQQQILQALSDQRTFLVSQIARTIGLRGQQDAALQRKIENLKAQVQQANLQMDMKDEFARTTTKNFLDFSQCNCSP